MLTVSVFSLSPLVKVCVKNEVHIGLSWGMANNGEWRTGQYLVELVRVIKCFHPRMLTSPMARANTNSMELSIIRFLGIYKNRFLRNCFLNLLSIEIRCIQVGIMSIILICHIFFRIPHLSMLNQCSTYLGHDNKISYQHNNLKTFA